MIDLDVAAVTPVAPAAAFGNKHCIFVFRGSHFALGATLIREITHAPSLVRVPQCPPSLAGICHIRSEFVPVVFLDPLLGENGSTMPKPKQLLVLHSSVGSWALMIDRVIAIDDIETHVDADYRTDGHVNPVLGTATYRSDVVRVLDPSVLHQLVQLSRPIQWDGCALGQTDTTTVLQRTNV